MDKSILESKKEDFLMDEADAEKSKNTLTHYDHVITLFLESLTDENVTKKDVRRFKEQLLERYKPSTVQNYIVVINKFLKYAQSDESMRSFEKIGLSEMDVYELRRKVRSKEIDQSALEDIRKMIGFTAMESLTVRNIKVQQRASLEEIIDEDEYMRLLKAARREKKLNMRMIMKVLRETGIRIEELRFITVESIKSHYVQVNNKAKIRNIIIRTSLRKELKAYCKQQGITAGYIFPGRNPDMPISTSAVWKNLKQIAGKEKVKKSKVHPHSFRHLFAVSFLEQGGSLAELSDILGHSSIETTRIYVRTTDKMKLRKLDNMSL